MHKKNSSLDKLVIIKGYDCTEFGWLKNHRDKSVQTVGIPLKLDDQIVYVSILEGLINCHDIYAFCGCRQTDGSLWRMELKIVYQFAAINLVILMPRYNDSCWVPVTPVKHTTTPVKITANDLFYLKCEIKQMVTAHNLELQQYGSNVKLIVETYDMTYVGPVIKPVSYLPENYYLTFSTHSLDENKIYGCPVFDQKQNLIGIVTHTEHRGNSSLTYVLPSTMINCMLEDFFSTSQTSRDHSKNNFVTLSVSTKQVVVLPIRNKILDTFDDTVMAIDDKDVRFLDEFPCIYDDTYDDYVPINVYAYLKCRTVNPTSMKITLSNRSKKTDIHLRDLPQHCDIFHLNRDTGLLDVSNRSMILPVTHLPYVKLSHLIIMQLTHEFLDIMAQNCVNLNNDIINGYLIGEASDLGQYLIIVDCDDNDAFAYKYDLPQLSKMINNSECREMQFPLLLRVNDLAVDKLSDLDSSKKVSNITVSTGFDTVRRIAFPGNTK